MLLQQSFEVTDIDPHGKKFDRVSRIVCSSDSLTLTLDVNTEIFPLEPSDKLSLLLTYSLSGNVDSRKKQTYTLPGKSIADDYDYVMYGKVFKYDDNGSSLVSVYCSFGGLLMCLQGDYRQLQQISVGEYLYLLIRK
jgi:DNA-directed RNA polymerase I, II, and III subunit RPABC3